MSLHITNAHTELPRCGVATIFGGVRFKCTHHLDHDGDHYTFPLNYSWPRVTEPGLVCVACGHGFNQTKIINGEFVCYECAAKKGS